MREALQFAITAISTSGLVPPTWKTSGEDRCSLGNGRENQQEHEKLVFKMILRPQTILAITKKEVLE